MLILFFFILFNQLVHSRCLDKDGSFILNVQIHLDEMTANKVLAVEKTKGVFNGLQTDRRTLVDYLNGIFDDMNKDLRGAGVQLRGDYSNLLFEELEIDLQKNKLCNTKLMAIEATTRLFGKLAYPKTNGLGLRIVGLSCLIFDPMQIPFFVMPTGGCGNIGTIFVIDPFTLKTQIKYLVKSFISEGVGAIYPINSDTFKKHLCHFANRCAVNNDLFGKFEQNLEKVDFMNGKKKEKNGYRNLRNKSR